MIRKERKIPIKILKLEALLRRLSKAHLKYPLIKEDLSKIKAGYRGEQSLDYYLSFLSNEKYHILHDLRLPHKTHHFQIDSLLLSPNFILIMEIKNIAGTLYFDHSFRQFIRTIDGKEEVFPNPLFQIVRHKMQLTNWLKEHQILNVPVENLLIFSNSSAIIKSSNPHSHTMKPIIQSAELILKIEELEKKYTIPIITDKQIKKIIKNLLKNHIALEVDVLGSYSILPQDIIIGVVCSHCGSYPIDKINGNWKCRNCGNLTKRGHLDALTDYALLFDTKISNKEMRSFLNLNSRNAAAYLMRKEGFPAEGEKRGTVYNLSSLIE
ncbi:NERD domain-containing protein [Metabacillus sp. KIGAM252]|uniref:NERD domain-containing protein n=1 Tax=Metabacillus flavus TaxID=2823519 RepID=A0ABS5LIC3_9BACI|nr:nuclease-related domain-containing protein [Metabacillus flavus]MBS2970501.1 NERD domain-containing protein [Metabacillus flavus]